MSVIYAYELIINMISDYCMYFCSATKNEAGITLVYNYDFNCSYHRLDI